MKHKTAIRITPSPLGPGYRGRRARRQAFADRQRICRLLKRVYRASLPEHEAKMRRALESVYLTGMAWFDGGGALVDRREVML